MAKIASWMPLKSKRSSARTVSTWSSPKESCPPAARPPASATTSATGKPRSASVFSTSRPTVPVAPATATL